jgi:hypothetical protein
VWGSFAYDNTLHPVYKELDRLYPNFLFRALTDDLPVFATPKDDDWQKFYVTYAAYLEDFDRLAAPLGVTLHQEKMKLLLPVHAPDPDDLSIFPDHLLITRDGLVIAGAAVGTPEFVKKIAAEKAEEVIEVASRITPLAALDPQATWRLLGSCANNKLSYFARVTPPSLLLKAAETADQGMDDARMTILTPFGQTNPTTHHHRRLTAKKLASLPARLGGTGHVPLSTTAPAAFIGSLAAACEDDAFRSRRHHLSLFAEQAHALALASAGGPTKITPGSRLALALPANAADICNSSYYPDLITENPQIRIQSTIAEAAHRHAREQLRDECHPDACNDANRFTTSDTINVHLATSRSQISRIFQCSLWHTANRVPATQFVAYLRYYLTLPQLSVSGDPVLSPKIECDVDSCHLPHCNKNRVNDPSASHLDPSGDHAIRCTSTYQARYNAHRMLCTSTVQLAREIGLEATSEPPTTNLLLNEFTDEQCRLMFPKNPNKELNKTATEANRLVLHIRNCKKDRDAAGAKRAQDKLDRLRAELSDKTQGRRVDVLITDNSDGAAFACDFAGIHPTGKNIRTNSKKWVKSLHAAEQEARDNNKPNKMDKEQSPAVAKTVDKKNKVYAQLKKIANLQMENGSRRAGFEFYPTVTSHMGEFSHGVFVLMTWLTDRYRASLKLEGPRDDGQPPSLLLANFRKRFKDALAASIVKGWGGALLHAGINKPRPARQMVGA